MSKNKEGAVAVMKTVWTKNSSGQWSIDALNSIDLKPRTGFGNRYYKIEREMNILNNRPGNLGSIDFFSSFGTTDFLIGQSIVPVVAWNEGDEELRCIGTAFFISASGYLLTAAHVLRDPVDERYGKFTPLAEHSLKLDPSFRIGVLLRNNPAARGAPFDMHPAMRDAFYFIHQVEWACHWGSEQISPLFHEAPQFDYDIDVAVLKVGEHPFGGAFQPLNIGTHTLKIGDRAVAIGYAEMKNIPTNPGGRLHEFMPEIFVSVGQVTNVYPNNSFKNRQSPAPGPCFDFGAKIPGKMSGCPILVGSGIITKGIVSRSWQDEEHATGCLIAPMMSLPLEGRGSLFDLMKSGTEGIAEMSGPDL